MINPGGSQCGPIDLNHYSICIDHINIQLFPTILQRSLSLDITFHSYLWINKRDNVTLQLIIYKELREAH